MESIHASASVLKEAELSQRIKDTKSTRSKGKEHRATVEQVLDPRTLSILHKLLSSGEIKEINGCISTGKEANVYHAVAGDGRSLAIKIYKTSILVFKDRDKYVLGERRFQTYCKSNPRKMVKMWAEKEMRNLKRLQNHGIPSPQPLILRSHVLVMDFIGKDYKAAPRLKDVHLSAKKVQQCYVQCLQMMWKMFHECKLVHADLSEYNILYFKGVIYIIDVSQSVEFDHPQAFDFLRMDCTNVTDYFRKKGAFVLGLKKLLEFILDASIVSEQLENRIEELLNESYEAMESGVGQDFDVSGFKSALIPRTVNELFDFETESGLLQQIDTDQVILTQDFIHLMKEEEMEDSSDDDDEEEQESDEEEKLLEPSESVDKEDIRLQRKENKKTVKAEQREKRTQKMKKKEKKRKVKQGKGKH